MMLINRLICKVEEFSLVTHPRLFIMIIVTAGVGALWALLWLLQMMPCEPFLGGNGRNITPQFILASINALISSSQAAYINRLEDKIDYFKRSDKNIKFRWIWIILVSGFFSLALSTLMAVFRIMLWSVQKTYGRFDELIVVTTGYGYVLLFFVALKSWLIPLTLKKLPNPYKHELSDDNTVETSSSNTTDLKTKSEDSFYYQLLGMRILELSKDGKASIAVDLIETKHFHLYGQMHGGVTLSLADAAGGAALAAMLDHDQKVATISLSLHFTASADKGRIRADARVVNRGRHYGTVEVTVSDEKGNIVGQGIATYAILSHNE